jgi:hypothetical protein
MSYLKVPPGQILNIFMQNISVPISTRTALPYDIKRMILAARKYHLKFTALSIGTEIKLRMPMWKHPAAHSLLYQQANRREAARCLRLNHQVRTVGDTLAIANRRTTVIRKPHQLNPSGIGRKNCGCPACQRDRTLCGCEHPGNCIETAKILIDSILPKWNPTAPNLDLNEELALSDEELKANEQSIGCDEIMTFDPIFALLNLEKGFRIFACSDALTDIPTRRYKLPGPQPELLTVYLHARIVCTLVIIMPQSSDSLVEDLIFFTNNYGEK